jgi:hypothetical protein
LAGQVGLAALVQGLLRFSTAISFIGDKRLKKGKTIKMSKVQVYDKPMCCSTGICGPQVDPVLPRFAADLDWLKSQGMRSSDPIWLSNLRRSPLESC